MRAIKFVSRLLLVFILAFASTNAWSYSETNVADRLTGEKLEQSSILIDDVSLWPTSDEILVANNDVLPSADISLNVYLNAQPSVNDHVTVVVRVRNHGPDDAVISAATVVPTGYRNIYKIESGGVLHGNVVTWENFSIHSGEVLDLTFRVQVNEPTGSIDEYKLVGQITKSDKLDPDSSPNNDNGDQSEDDEDFASITPLSNVADLSLHKDVDISNPLIGETVTFTIRVNDAGPSGTDYALEDIIPSGFSNISNINRGGVLRGNKIRWGGQWIDAHQTQEFTFTATVDAPDCNAVDQYKNIAQITHNDRPDPDSTPNNDDGDQSEDDEDFAIVTPNTNICDQVADLSLHKSVNNPTPNIGDTVTFTLNIANAGPDAATNVGISDVIPAGYTNIANISSAGILNGNTITWMFTDLAANDSLTVTFTADVLAPTGAANEYVNTAQVSASDQLDPDSTPNNDDGDQSEDDEDNAVVTPNVGQGTADLS
ncbi:MAG: hypothetical protein AB8B92_02650, partial [Gammaproteobacteria bacterium]